MKIDGRKIAEEIIERLKNKVVLNDQAPLEIKFLTGQAQGKILPNKILAVVYVGENPASEAFIKQKKKVAEELGVDFRIYRFSGEMSNDKLRAEVVRIARQGAVGGVIVQLPLPEKFNRQKILNAAPAEKDVDVLSEKAWGVFSLGRGAVLPPAVGVVEEILLIFNFQLSTSCVAVVGAGTPVGKPVAAWLSGKVKKLAIFDEGSDLGELSEYDLVVTGVGKGEIIKPEFLKEGASVIDFGYEGGRGDLDASDESKLEKLAFWTPTPGGTGPILVAKLFENFYKLNRN